MSAPSSISNITAEPDQNAPAPATAVWTVGHSNRPLDAFLRLLENFAIRHLLDVRKMPRSRANPQFNIEGLPDSLSRIGIAYSHLPALGGLRRANADSCNAGWRNRSFRGYADYMQTAPFEQALEELIAYARATRCALMCAEAVPWRCHRWLIADALVVRGLQVEHILAPSRTEGHRLSAWAKIDGTRLHYPVVGH
jgi:uncharacterized protein (DUF488 family)